MTVTFDLITPTCSSPLPEVIRQVRTDDFDSILRINAECSPNVAKLDTDELRRLVAFDGVAWVAEHETHVVGYLLGMSSAAAYDGEEFQWFRSSLDQPFLYIDQIAVGAEARRTNVAAQLYEHLIEHSRAHSIHVLCCEVNLRPANPASLKFHDKLGFEKTGELETGDGRRVALLFRRT